MVRNKIASVVMGVSLVATTACGDTPNSEDFNVVKDTPQTPQYVDMGSRPIETLPKWERGMLDIHFINATTGESYLIVMPDGTKMLVDAASSLTQNGNKEIFGRWKPNGRGSQIVGDYVRSCLNSADEPLDYLLVTHFHNDHIGGYDESLPYSQFTKSYRINGVTEILDLFKVNKIVDRGYPNYDYPYDLMNASKNANIAAIVKNYRQATAWHSINRGLQREGFRPGTTTQFEMKRSPQDFPDFKIQNLYVNGQIWTGSGEEVRDIFPSKESFSGSGDNSDAMPSENHCSTAFTIHYGKFDFYGGADVCNSGVTTYSWKGVENELAKVVAPVDVMKADHHGVSGANAPSLLSKLDPAVILCSTWQDIHPRAEVHARFVSNATHGGTTKLFYGNLAQSMFATFESGMRNIQSREGHVVVRVFPGGDSYIIYVVQDKTQYPMGSNEWVWGKHVVRTFGPYQCK